MKALLQWIEDRSGAISAAQNAWNRPMPGGACWCKVWPSTMLFTSGVLIITGVFLWMHYSASAQSAWESVYYLQNEVAGGWLLRAMHHYAGHVLLVLVGLYLVQMIALGAYRAPRELVFWVTVLMGVICLGLLLTGDLLPWDRNSVSATQARVNFLALLPWIGGDLIKLAVGGAEFGHLTLTRFVALHMGVLTGALLVLLALQWWFTRRAEKAELALGARSTPYGPSQAVRNCIANFAVLGVILWLSLQHGISGEHAGVALGSPADPVNSYAAARPEWAFLGLYEFSHFFSGPWMILPIFVIPGLLFVVVMAMPLTARLAWGHPLNIALTAVLLIGITVLSLQSVAKDRADPEHQAAVQAEQEQAARVRLLALGHGIPGSGALTLLRSDAKTQGPLLFKECASCHNPQAKPGEGAPDLAGYAQRQWVAGWFDPKTLTGPQYFGNTKFRAGKMVGFIKDTFKDVEGDELKELKQDFAKITAAVSAEAGLKSQEALDQKDAAMIKEGQKLMTESYGCTDCHRFHGKGGSDAPDLTGYGSRDWTIGIITNPGQKRFYGKNNDRMPAYAQYPDEPAKNLMSTRNIELLTDWLRGEWYEAE